MAQVSRSVISVLSIWRAPRCGAAACDQLFTAALIHPFQSSSGRSFETHAKCQLNTISWKTKQSERTEGEGERSMSKEHARKPRWQGTQAQCRVQPRRNHACSCLSSAEPSSFRTSVPTKVWPSEDLWLWWRSPKSSGARDVDCRPTEGRPEHETGARQSCSHAHCEEQDTSAARLFDERAGPSYLP
jgi:hypothetical protein